jgi:signal transduction histidine kinase
VGPTLAVELDLDRLVQSVTDIATQLVGAEFGSLFQNMTNDAGESYLLHTLSGVPREAFAQFPMPRNTEVLGQTFRGQGIVRSDDITQDARYGSMAPYQGMPEDQLPVRSYLAAPVISRSGDVLGGLFFGHSKPGQFTARHEDILRGLAAQAAIAMDNARLFERSQKAQDDLRRSNEELRRVNKDLETFAYSASHDLQEPLRIVSINSQLIERRGGELPENTRDFLRNIQEGAARMRTLLGDLLSYTRAIRQADGPVPVLDSGTVLAKVLENLRSSIDESCAVVTHDPMPPVRMMDVHLTQVLQNLIGNALKYRRAEAPRVHVSAVERNGIVTFTVADNGIGVDPRFRHQIFGLFKRLHTREEYPGSGVGLAICERVVEQYGGRIWVEEQRSGPGSVFHFTVTAG